MVVKKFKPASAEAPKSMVFEATMANETPGTFRMAETGPKDQHISGGIYLKKSALGDIAPTKVRVTIEIL